MMRDTFAELSLTSLSRSSPSLLYCCAVAPKSRTVVFTSGMTSVACLMSSCTSLFVLRTSGTDSLTAAMNF